MKFLFPSLAALCLLAACTRTTDDPDPVPDPPVEAKPLMVYEVDSTLPHPRDTVMRMRISYDAQGRPAQWLRTTYVPSTGDSTISYLLTYHYASSTDSVADYTDLRYRTILVNPATEYIRTYLFRSGGLLVKDSMLSTRNPPYRNSVGRYTRTAGIVNAFRTFSNDSATLSNKYRQQYSGANLLVQVDTPVYLHTQLGPTGFSNGYNSTYFNVANPFFTLSRPIFRDFLYDDILLFDKGYLIDTYYDAPPVLISHRGRQHSSLNILSGTSNDDDPDMQTDYTYQTDAQGRVTHIRAVTAITDPGGTSYARRHLVLVY